jgi:DNA processing protein
MKDELFYRIALTMIPELGPVRVKALIDHFGNATAVFESKKKELGMVETIGALRAKNISEWKDFAGAERELKFIEQHRVQPLFLTDPQYPRRLLHCYDPPSMLYYYGSADLNHSKIISIIGTRNHTAYGKQVTEELILALKAQSILIVSGLAFGIDAIAHKTALQNEIPTIGVLAHGLDTIYPQQHRTLSKEMLLHGGLLTEFRMSTQPDRHNFPKRNRIVAGMSDATIVIETAVKGGSMITAELAHQYNRDLFAVPGKITDPKSSGCLKLIQQNKAVLLSDAEQFIELMGWMEKKKQVKKQTALFIDLSKEEQLVVDLLKEKEPMPIDELYIKSGLSSSSMAGVILNLEMNNIIRSMPGKMFALY